ncbi:tetratricopeptide repeat protein [Pendulispora albinea]|uniref:Zinc-ribbon domain-containing protein n=1 Tax=Pendulispora albinea TaxID=2741071 RepID=A0ABZ2M1C4_9BACT
MLRVECEKCNTSYQVDERRVPETGLPMRCTKCNHTFTVSGDKAAAARLRRAGKNTLIAFGTVDEHGRVTLTSSPPRNTPLLDRSTPLLEAKRDAAVGRGSELPAAGRGSELPPVGRGSELPPVGRGSELPAVGRGSELPPAGRGSELPPVAVAPELHAMRAQAESVAEVGPLDREWFERDQPVVPPPGPSEEEILHELDWDVEPAIPQILTETQKKEEQERVSPAMPASAVPVGPAGNEVHVSSAGEVVTSAEMRVPDAVHVTPEKLRPFAPAQKPDEVQPTEVSEGDLVAASEEVDEAELMTADDAEIAGQAEIAGATADAEIANAADDAWTAAEDARSASAADDAEVASAAEDARSESVADDAAVASAPGDAWSAAADVRGVSAKADTEIANVGDDAWTAAEDARSASAADDAEVASAADDAWSESVADDAVARTADDAGIARTTDDARTSRTADDAGIARTADDARTARTADDARTSRTADDAERVDAANETELVSAADDADTADDAESAGVVDDAEVASRASRTTKPPAAKPPRIENEPRPDEAVAARTPELQQAMAPSHEALRSEIRKELEANPVVARAKAIAVAQSSPALSPKVPAQPEPERTDAPTPVNVPAVARSDGATAEKIVPKKRSKALWLAAAVVLAGGALEATPYGAFGRVPIGDRLHADEYARLAAEAAEKARSKMAADVFPDTTKAIEALARAQAETPRAPGFATYRAITESAARLRFTGGGPRDVEDAQRALAADPARASDEDALVLRGEIELGTKHPQAAADAFRGALGKRPSARAHFGLARAHRQADDLEASAKEVEATLSASPRHAGARVLRANLLWERTRNEAAVSEDLAAILEGPSKEVASPRELASAWALRGRIELERHRTSEARTAFEEARKREPREPSTLVGQGELLLREGRYTEALARFDAAMEIEPAATSSLGSAKAKLFLERPADAKTQLATLEKDHPRDARITHWLARTEEALGNPDLAERKYAEAIARARSNDRDAIASYADWAMLLARRGRAKDADQKLEEARGKFPGATSLARAFGDLAALEGLYEAALAHYQAALGQEPADVLTRFRKASTLRRMGTADQASAELDKVAEADKDYPGLALERAFLAAQSGDPDRGAALLRDILGRTPDDPDVQRRIGAAYATIGRPAEAVTLLRGALAKPNASAGANYDLARALFLLQGGPAEIEAPRLFKKAVELDPHRAAYHAGVAWVANEGTSAQPDVAKEHIEKALALDAYLADGYWQRGVLERKLGLLTESIRDLKRALELYPTYAAVHAALAEAFEQKNDAPSAQASWQKALSLNPQRPYWKYRYGRLLLARGSAGEAAKHMVFAVTEAKKVDPLPAWSMHAELTCAQALQKAGRSAEAIEHYRRFLDLSPQTSSDRTVVHAALASLGAK